MANHGYVKTKKSMTADDIQALIEELNRTTFKNGFTIERHNNIWHIIYGNMPSYGSRTFWLNSKPNLKSKSFEMRHGGGTSFIWWADAVIIDTVARKFDGVISDGGVESKWKPPEHNYTLAEYFQKMYGGRIVLDELMFVPPEFRDELKDLNWIR